MNKYVVKTDDKIVQQVIEKIDQRSLIGQAKYGAMMMEEVEGKDKDLKRLSNRCTRRNNGCIVIHTSSKSLLT